MAKNRNRKPKENRNRKKKAALIPSGIREVGPGLWVVRSQVISSRTGKRVERTRRVVGGLEEAVKAKVELDVRGSVGGGASAFRGAVAVPAPDSSGLHGAGASHARAHRVRVPDRTPWR